MPVLMQIRDGTADREAGGFTRQPSNYLGQYWVFSLFLPQFLQFLRDFFLMGMGGTWQFECRMPP
jgi:hypothetical protein